MDVYERFVIAANSVGLVAVVDVKDGRKIIGIVAKTTAFGFIFLKQAINRRIVGNKYKDTPLGVIRINEYDMLNFEIYDERKFEHLQNASFEELMETDEPMEPQPGTSKQP